MVETGLNNVVVHWSCKTSIDSHKPVKIGGLLPLTMQERGGYQEVQSAESHKPVEIGGLRAQGASGEWERLEIPERASGAVTGR